MKFFVDSRARWQEGFKQRCSYCGSTNLTSYTTDSSVVFCNDCRQTWFSITCLDQDGKNLIDESEHELLDCYNYLWRINRDKLRWLWLPMLPVCAGLFMVYYYLQTVSGIVGRERFDVNGGKK